MDSTQSTSPQIPISPTPKNPVIPPTPPIQSEIRRRWFQKPIFWVVSLVALIVVSLVSYLLILKSKTPISQITQPEPISLPTPIPSTIDETQNWKTYVNEAYKYSIKYPLSGLIETPTTDSLTIWSTNDKGVVLGTDRVAGTSHIDIVVRKYPPNNTLDQYVNQENNPNNDEVIYLSSKKTVAINGLEFIEYTYQNKITDISMYPMYLVKNDFVYNILFQSGEKSYFNHPFGQQILSTFKFTDQQSNQEPNQRQCTTKYESSTLLPPQESSTWKSFSTKEYSFRYPSTLNLLKDNRLSTSTQREIDQICSSGCEPSYGMDVEGTVSLENPKLNLKEYITQILGFPTCDSETDKISTTRLLRTIRIDNKYDAVYFQFNGCGGGSCDGFIVKDNNSRRVVRFISPNLPDSLINKIFSTFEFK